MQSCRLAERLPILRLPLLAIGLVALASCANAPQTRTTLSTSGAPVSLVAAPKYAQGLISTACEVNNRRSATQQTCGCIQAAANMTLSPSQQRRGAKFFDDPEVLQKMKLSDTPANEKFWDDWARFAETAEAICR
ncbi:MAG: hypothetical protein AAGF27_06120 [Pseudomonadota bacterium]